MNMLGVVLTAIRAQRKNMTEQEYRTLKGQCLHGDLIGAMRGLKKILDRKANKEG